MGGMIAVHPKRGVRRRPVPRVRLPLDDVCQYTCCIELEDVPTSSPTNSFIVPLSSDGKKCWVNGHSYGSVEDGSCAEASVVAVLAEDDKFNLGVSQGWWSDDIDRIDVDNTINDRVQPIDCQNECNAHDSCTGWDYNNEVCVLKSITPTIITNTATNATSICSPTLGKKKFNKYNYLDKVAGIKGCVDSESTLQTENSALDLKEFNRANDNEKHWGMPHRYCIFHREIPVLPSNYARMQCFLVQVFDHLQTFSVLAASSAISTLRNCGAVPMKLWVNHVCKPHTIHSRN